MEISDQTAARLEEGYELLDMYLLGVARVPKELKGRLSAKVAEIRALLDEMYEVAA